MPNFRKVNLLATTNRWKESMERKEKRGKNRRNPFTTDSYHDCTKLYTLIYGIAPRIYIYLLSRLHELIHIIDNTRLYRVLALLLLYYTPRRWRHFIYIFYWTYAHLSTGFILSPKIEKTTRKMQNKNWKAK